MLSLQPVSRQGLFRRSTPHPFSLRAGGNEQRGLLFRCVPWPWERLGSPPETRYVSGVRGAVGASSAEMSPVEA